MAVSAPTGSVGGADRPSGRRPFSFMRWRALGFAVTALLFALTTASLALQGLNFGLDFTGGVLVEATREAGFEPAALRADLAAAGVADATVQVADGSDRALVRVGLADDGEAQPIIDAIETALGPDAAIRRTDAIGPTVSGELLRDGLFAAALAVVMISVYVWFRFESKFGFAALITTFHDVYVVVGLFSLTRLTFDLATVAAILAVAGYSINDTVVVFDRIREMLRRYKHVDLAGVIDAAITSTLSRTLMTSATTLVTTITLMLLGGPVLFGFAAAITCGILVGTYSSIFVAAPLLIHLPGRALGGRDEAARLEDS